MKIEWSTVAEITIGVMVGTLLSGVVLGLFAKFLAKHGESIHGVADTTAKV